MRIAGFDWDDGNRSKCAKHGVYRDEIEEIFILETARVRSTGRDDPETRFTAVGVTGDGRHLFVVFTLRALGGGLRIRPISARYMHRKEVEAYEEANPHVPDG